MGAPDPRDGRRRRSHQAQRADEQSARALGVSAGAKSRPRPQIKTSSGAARPSMPSSCRSSKRGNGSRAGRDQGSAAAARDLRSASVCRRLRRSAGFLADNSPNAFVKVVDRLLASPALRRTLGPLLARYRALLRHRRRRTQPRSARAWTTAIPTRGPIAIGWCRLSTTTCPTTSSSREQLAADI